jgi:predicted lysophospholipase L1 biosynthesis ABC-type transport system permease subunit
VRGRGSLAREYTVTYRATLEANERIVAGAAWDARPAPGGEVSIEESIRDRFGIDIGDTIRFDVLGRVVSAEVTTVRHVEWSDSRAGGFMFVFRPGLLDTAPHGHIASARSGCGGRSARLLSTLARGIRTSRSSTAAKCSSPSHRGRQRDARRDRRRLACGRERSAHPHRRRGDDEVPRVYEAAILKTLGATRRHRHHAVARYGVPEPSPDPGPPGRRSPGRSAVLRST